MTRLVLIRHGQTDWNVEGRWQGQADVPLNAHGLEQAQAIAKKVASSELQAIYSSDLQRARRTAEELSKLTGLEVRLDARLREIHQGEWQGMLVGEIQSRYKEAFLMRQKNPLTVSPPGGETVKQVKERVLSAIQDILHCYPHGRVAVVSHGFALAVMRVHFLGKPIDQVWKMIPENDEVLELEVDA